MQLTMVIMLSIALLYSSPALIKRMSYTPSTREVSFAFVVVLVSAGIFSIVPQLPTLTVTDVIVAGCLYNGWWDFFVRLLVHH
jgi:zinc transporter 5/7